MSGKIDICKTLRTTLNKTGKPLNAVIGGLNEVPIAINRDIIPPLDTFFQGTVNTLNAVPTAINTGVNGTIRVINTIYTDCGDLLLLISNAALGGVFAIFRLLILPYLVKGYAIIQAKLPFLPKKISLRTVIRIAGLIILLPLISNLWYLVHQYEISTYFFVAIAIAVIFLLK